MHLLFRGVLPVPAPLPLSCHSLQTPGKDVRAVGTRDPTQEMCSVPEHTQLADVQLLSRWTQGSRTGSRQADFWADKIKKILIGLGPTHGNANREGDLVSASSLRGVWSGETSVHRRGPPQP